ncbi:MAG: hypothetical protein AAFN63_07045 [Pseudomonadota bacterium]
MKYAHQSFGLFIRGRSLARRFCVVAVALLGLITAPAMAQDGSTVTLKYDAGEGLTGELVEVNDQVVVLRGSIGLVTVPVEGVTCIGQACPDSMRFVSSAPMLTFTTLDGSVAVQGQLVEISNDQYVIATNLGELRFNVDGAICTGEGCPVTLAETQFGGDVVLTNGTTAIEGQLVGFEGTSYIVEVANVGPIRVDSNVFDCSGDGCP